MSAVDPFKVICLFKTIHMRHVWRVRIYVTTAVPMDRFAYMRQRGCNQATPVLLASANGSDLRVLVSTASSGKFSMQRSAVDTKTAMSRAVGGGAPALANRENGFAPFPLLSIMKLAKTRFDLR
jgi:hypothetical protein